MTYEHLREWEAVTAHDRYVDGEWVDPPHLVYLRRTLDDGSWLSVSYEPEASGRWPWVWTHRGPGRDDRGRGVRRASGFAATALAAMGRADAYLEAEHPEQSTR